MKMNLQYFAEDETNEEATAEQTQQEKPEAKKQDDKPAAKYTDEDVDKLINKKFATHKSEIEELKAELESVRTKGMSEEEEKSYKQEREEKQLSDRIKNLEAKEQELSLKEQTMTAKSLFAEKDINQGYVDFILDTGKYKTPEDKLEAFIDYYTEDLVESTNKNVKQALSGTSPRILANGGKALTKADIMNEKDASKRIKLIQENPNLFK